MDKEVLEKITKKIKAKDYELISNDVRGKIWRLEVDGKEYILMYTVKGEVRGGDFHKSVQHDFALKGRVFFIEKTCLTCPDGKGENLRVVHPGQEIILAVGVPHMMVSFDESLVLEWLEGPFEKTYYRPFRDKIEAKPQ